MKVKKNYNIGDTVWIYGITASNKITKGTVISSLDLSDKGYGSDLHYIIDVPSHIEPLLEIRTWQTISQDQNGPVGSIRALGNITESDDKKIRQTGYIYSIDSHYDIDDPSPDQIREALEKSTDGLTHKPLTIKDSNHKRRYYPKRKKS